MAFVKGVSVDDKSMDLSECIFGKKYFIEGLEQLTSYLTWRDTKMSYIIFSRLQNISDTISKAKDNIENHQNFISIVQTISESSIQYKLKQKADTNKKFLLTLHIIDIK